jgi:hypothetical protein
MIIYDDAAATTTASHQETSSSAKRGSKSLSISHGHVTYDTDVSSRLRK